MARDTAYQTIMYSVQDGAADIALNRPDTLNSLNTAMRKEIAHAVARAEAEGARAILLRAEGRAFCAGQDLGEARRREALDLERTLRDEYEPMLRAITDSPLPVIACVTGVAAGAGVSLALAADMVFAADDASFTVAFARIGLVPDVGLTYFLPRLVGLPLAMGLSLTTEPMSGLEAERIGLVWRAAPTGEILGMAQAQAAALAKGPGRSYALMKRALRRSLDNDFDAQLALEAESQGAAGQTADFAEGVAAFLEKRAPQFRGQ